MAHLLLDIGNTRTKAAVAENGSIIATFVAANLESLAIGDKCEQYQVVATIASVVGKMPDFERLLPPQAYSSFHLLTSRSRLPIDIDYETPQTLGMDRVAAVVGARELSPASPLMVVDAGSCITIDILDNNNCYRGGSILPGIQMRLRSLHDYTASLPLVELTEAEHSGVAGLPLTGRSTRDSIVSGVLKALLFEIQGFADSYSRLYPGLKLFLTGGDAVFFAKQLFFPNFANSNLLFIGLDKILGMNV